MINKEANIGVNGLCTGLFTVADVAIMIGVALIVLAGARRPGVQRI